MRQKGETEEWDIPVEGVPPWLSQALMDWLYERVIHDEDARGPRKAYLRAIEVTLRLPLNWLVSEHTAYESLKEACTKNPEVFLDVLDYALRVVGDEGDNAKALEVVLGAGGSAWDVAPDNAGLTRRVLPQAAQTAKEITSRGSRAGTLLGAAWRHVYGRNPEPGTGYREAVRAIEAAACPAIIPDDPAPSLGKAIAALRDAPKGKYVTIFPETTLDGRRQDPLEAVWKLMQLVWKSELDRHTPADESVPLSVTREQAEAALHAAVTLVQWFQRGFVRLA